MRYTSSELVSNIFIINNYVVKKNYSSNTALLRKKSAINVLIICKRKGSILYHLLIQHFKKLKVNGGKHVRTRAY